MSVRLSSTTLIISLLSAGIVLISTALVAFTLGKHARYADVGRPLSAEQQASFDSQQASYAKGLETLRSERDRIANDFDAACYEYQKLYAAYDALYAQSGHASGVPKLGIPGSARGSQSECYQP